jgi:ATP-dependent protease ClpP protease subunit
MPDWNQILNEKNAAGSVYDVIRRKYLEELHKFTGRNTIIYYSGWLQKKGVDGTEINDEDKIGFMTTIHELDRKLGLDLVLHTPGGETAATESLVDYLRSMFDTDIRAIVPQLAMSGGTMIACACKEIVMGKQSSLGPIDPHFGGVPAHGVIEEFERAVKEVKEDPAKIPLWQVIIAKYNPAFIGECKKAITWSNEMTGEWLRSGMFVKEANPEDKIAKIVQELSDHALTKSHARHLTIQKCKEIGLKVLSLEDDQIFQDKVLSLHHSCMITFSATGAFKIIENHRGKAFVKLQQQVIVAKN